MVDGYRFGCAVTIILLFIGALLFSIGIDYHDPHWETITVKEKTISVGKHPSYLVYSKYGVFEIQDMTFAGFFTSSDVYSAIEPGKTYRVYVMGRRIPFLSAYKNIVEVQPANEDNHGK